MATEIELKLAAPAAELATLERALLELAPGAACARSSLTTTYYDTADRALSRRKLALRVREVDGRFVQTLKADGAPEAGLLTRGEWEDEIGGGRPDPQAPNSGRHLPPGLDGELEPLFASAVTRTTIRLEPAPSLCIEAAIDSGEIRGIAAAAAAPISEVELELKRGEPAALFDTALDLLRAVPLRLETRSKAERGYAAIAGEAAAPKPVSAAPVGLAPALRVDEALQRIGRACLAHLLHNEAAALAGEPEGVHQMRVAARRLQAALAAFKKILPKEQRRQVKARLDGVDDALAPARNLDVFKSDLLPPGRAAVGEPGYQALLGSVEAARRAAYTRIRELILSPSYTESVLWLLRWFEAQGWRDGASPACGRRAAAAIGAAAPDLLDRRRRRSKKRGKGFGRADARRRHRLRIALKELRYAAELLAGLFEQRQVRRYVKRLKELQDDLGYANDVRVGRDTVAQLGAGDPDTAGAGELLLRWHAPRVARRERKVKKHMRRLMRARPFWERAPAPHSAAAPSPTGQATPVPPSPQ